MIYDEYKVQMKKVKVDRKMRDKMKKQTQHKLVEKEDYVALGISLGMCFGSVVGIIVGMFIHEIPLSMIFGIAIGLALGSGIGSIMMSSKTEASKKREGKE